MKKSSQKLYISPESISQISVKHIAGKLPACAGDSLQFEATISNYFKYKLSSLPNNNTAFYIGTSYRVLDAMILAARADVKGFTINFSYDINLSKLSAVSGANGGPEIGISYTGCLKRNYKQTYCPDF